jgi:ACS family tartrate transporter-like MFS transporter
LIIRNCCTVLAGFLYSPLQFYGARLLLGMAEAGFFPIVILYLSSWFPARVRAAALSGMIVAVPISFVIRAPLSVACITHENDSSKILIQTLMFGRLGSEESAYGSSANA